MKTKRTNRPTWILAIASAYAVLPGCGDDAEQPEEVQPLDAGGIVIPPRDGGPGIDAGLIVMPPDAGVMVMPPHDAGCVPGAAPDGGCKPSGHT
jgi:hypothetical protein